MADSLVLYNDDEGNLRGFLYKDQRALSTHLQNKRFALNFKFRKNASQFPIFK